MTCIKCGENVPDTANFCPRCGAVVSKEGRKSKTKFNVGWITIAAGFSQWCGNVSKSILTGDDMATWVGWTVLAITLIVGIALIVSSRSIRLQSTASMNFNAVGGSDHAKAESKKELFYMSDILLYILSFTRNNKINCSEQDVDALMDKIGTEKNGFDISTEKVDEIILDYFKK